MRSRVHGEWMRLLSVFYKGADGKMKNKRIVCFNRAAAVILTVFTALAASGMPGVSRTVSAEDRQGESGWEGTFKGRSIRNIGNGY